MLHYCRRRPFSKEEKEIGFNILCNALYIILIHYKMINYIHLNKEKNIFIFLFMLFDSFFIPIIFQTNRRKKKLNAKSPKFWTFLNRKKIESFLSEKSAFFHLSIFYSINIRIFLKIQLINEAYN